MRNEIISTDTWATLITNPDELLGCGLIFTLSHCIWRRCGLRSMSSVAIYVYFDNWEHRVPLSPHPRYFSYKCYRHDGFVAAFFMGPYRECGVCVYTFISL
eukprot:802523_1